MMQLKKKISGYLNTRKLHPVSIAGHDPVRLLFVDGAIEVDITDFHAMISLRPFAIAVNASTICFSKTSSAMLQIVSGEKIVGTLRLKPAGIEICSEVTLKIYEAMLTNNPLSKSILLGNGFLLWLKNVTNKKSQNFVVPPSELLKLFVFSLKPRPVFLVSVQHENGFDIFPVDIAGNISETHCVFSIRSTSASIPHIMSIRKICAAAIPLEQHQVAYHLGRHHSGGILSPADAQELIFSEQWKIPVPAFAMQIRELQLEHSFIKGAHTQLVFRSINSYKLHRGSILAHTPWFNRNYFKNSFDLPK